MVNFPLYLKEKDKWASVHFSADSSLTFVTESTDSEFLRDSWKRKIFVHTS